MEDIELLDGAKARQDGEAEELYECILIGIDATMAFADSSAKTWSGTLLIKGWRDGAVRFGDSAAALTDAQLQMIRAEKPNGKTMRLRLTSSGYLAQPGMIISVR